MTKRNMGVSWGGGVSLGWGGGAGKINGGGGDCSLNSLNLDLNCIVTVEYTYTYIDVVHTMNVSKIAVENGYVLY